MILHLTGTRWGGGKWYCNYPKLRECHDPAMLPVDEVRIKRLSMNNIGLGNLHNSLCAGK
jgi:hypothetical protein